MSPKVNARVNGTKTIALLDSGAIYSCVDESFLEKVVFLPSKIKEREILCRGVGSSPIKISKTVLLRIKIDGLTWDRELLILPGCPVSIILGADFMEHAGMTLNFVSKTYSFKARPGVIGYVLPTENEEGDVDSAISSKLSNDKKKRLQKLLENMVT